MDGRPTKASILAALSLALDLVEGQPEGHAIRCCRIALRLGQEIGLPEADLTDLTFAGLLKDSGCSNNSVRIHNIFGGDDLASKKHVKLIDWTSPAESLRFAFANTERGRSVGAKLRRMAANVGPPSKVMREVTEARCTRGADIARMLGFSAAVSAAIRDLDEHWDGRGAPVGRSGDDIPLHARILGLVQTFEVFLTAFGGDSAYAVAASRSGRWFDPDLVRALESMRGDSHFWWDYHDHAVADSGSIDLPGLDAEAVDVDVDRICDAFGMIVDAKSSFTWEHSVRVARLTTQLAEWFSVSSEEAVTLRRAALLHDIGKLGISTGILEKPGRLDADEMAAVHRHPKLSYEILKRVPTFGRIAEIASGHHERLDGKGYWRSVGADAIDLDTRILTAADVFDALITRRPYKDALPLESVLEILDREAGAGLDPACVEALHEVAGEIVAVAA